MNKIETFNQFLATSSANISIWGFVANLLLAFSNFVLGTFGFKDLIVGDVLPLPIFLKKLNPAFTNPDIIFFPCSFLHGIFVFPLYHKYSQLQVSIN